jgi:hypothetical protein
MRPHPFFATRGSQKNPVVIHRPVPPQIPLGKNLVKRGTMRLLGFRQGAIYIKDQRAQGHL